MFEKLIQFIPDSLSPTCQIKITSSTGEPVLTVFLPALACEERFRKVGGA
jgi:mannosyltransferase OCH1-like enzyme